MPHDPGGGHRNKEGALFLYSEVMLNSLSIIRITSKKDNHETGYILLFRFLVDRGFSLGNQQGLNVIY